MAKKIVLLPVFCLGLSAVAQVERIDTDRPDQTESAAIVPKKYFQAEFGFNIEKEKGLTGIIHPTVLWKYGAAKRFEFRLITEFVSVETPIIIPNGNTILTGLLPVQIGGKLALWEEKSFLPKTSLIFHIAPAKLGSKKFQASKWAPDFVFTMQHTLSKNTGFGYNLGAAWDGESNIPYWVYTFAPGFNIGKKWYGYFEIFGAIRKNEAPQHSFDGGLAYYINSNIKIDISSGFGLSEAAADWYGALGFSFRVNTMKKR